MSTCDGGCQCHDVSSTCGYCCADVEADTGLPCEFELLVVYPQVRQAIVAALSVCGWELFPVPNGSDSDGNPAFVDDALPVYGVRVRE